MASSHPDVIRLLCDNGAEPRLAMRGTSMLPLLREPMVLQLGRFSGKPKRGDVLVFGNGEQLVAHRFVAMKQSGMLLLAGDSRPGSYDVISPKQVIGTVKAVWSDASPAARRVDRLLYRVHGALVGFQRAIAVRVRCAIGTQAPLTLRAFDPRRRPRVYLALFLAMAAIVQGDRPALRRALVAVDPDMLLAMIERHRCAPIFIDGVEALDALDVLPERVLSALRKERWSTAAQTRVLRREVDRTLSICSEIGVVPILLKGAARVFVSERDSDRYDSGDIDILLPREHIAAVTTAYRALGYHELPGDVERYASQHHTAPLHAPAGHVTVELHHMLAPPGEMIVNTEYAHFGDRTVLHGSAPHQGAVLTAFAAALHSTIHAREPGALRNLIVLARQLRELTPDELDKLYAVADAEDRQRHRLHAALYAATQMAGLPGRPTTTARRLVDWRMRRFDLPNALFDRSEAIEWFIGTGGRSLDRIASGLLPWESDSEKNAARAARMLRYTLKLPVKLAMVAFTSVYAILLRTR